MKNASLLSAAIITLCLISPAHAQTLTEAIIEADGEAYFSLPEPPVGMSLTKTPLNVGDKLLGFQLGYDITVIAVNEEDLDRLSAWAKKVRPVVVK
jgi:hypothetical protein